MVARGHGAGLVGRGVGGGWCGRGGRPLRWGGEPDGEVPVHKVAEGSDSVNGEFERHLEGAHEFWGWPWPIVASNGADAQNVKQWDEENHSQPGGKSLLLVNGALGVGGVCAVLDHRRRVAERVALGEGIWPEGIAGSGGDSDERKDGGDFTDEFLEGKGNR